MSQNTCSGVFQGKRKDVETCTKGGSNEDNCFLDGHRARTSARYVLIIFTSSPQPKARSRNRCLNEPIIWPFPVYSLHVLDYWPPTRWNCSRNSRVRTHRWAVSLWLFFFFFFGLVLWVTFSYMRKKKSKRLLSSLVSVINV